MPRVRQVISNRKCEICKIDFAPKHKRQLCCSKKCGYWLGRKSIDVVATGRKISASRIKAKEEGRIVYTGHPHSEETKAHLSKLAKDRLSVPENNPMFGKKRSDESRDKQSKTRSERFVDGTYQWHTWNDSGNVFSSKLNREVFCRSSWEKKAVEIFDSDLTVTSFEEEPFSVTYMQLEGDREHTRHYIPDFVVTYVDGSKKLIEIKPECFLTAAVNLAKFAAAREYCLKNSMQFEVWTQKRLGLS